LADDNSPLAGSRRENTSRPWVARMLDSRGMLVTVTVLTLGATLLSAAICAITYALVDPSLFRVPVALAMPVVTPLLSAPPVIYQSLRSRRDIHLARRETEARARELEAMVAERDRILRLIGHDLAGHLGLVIGFAGELAKKDVPEWTRVDHAIEIERAGRAAHDVLRELLLWGRMTIGAEETQLAPVDARELVDRVAQLMRGLAAAKGVLLEAFGASVSVRVDRRQIEAGLRNLIANAVRHTPRSGSIVVSVETGAGARAGMVGFAVRDNGSGMSADQLAALRDGSGDRKPAQQDGQSGLGLLLCHEVARRHGGRLDLDSKPNAGTTAILWVPAG